MLCEQGSWGHVCLYANQENITEHHQWGKVITANAVHRDCSWQLRASRLWWSKLEEREKQQLQQTAWSRGSPWQSVNKVEPQTMSFDMMKSRTRATAGEGAKKTGKARKGSFNVLHLILIIDGTTQVLTYWEAPCSCKKKKKMSVSAFRQFITWFTYFEVQKKAPEEVGSAWNPDTSSGFVYKILHCEILGVTVYSSRLSRFQPDQLEVLY